MSSLDPKTQDLLKAIELTVDRLAELVQYNRQTGTKNRQNQEIEAKTGNSVSPSPTTKPSHSPKPKPKTEKSKTEKSKTEKEKTEKVKTEKPKTENPNNSKTKIDKPIPKSPESSDVNNTNSKTKFFSVIGKFLILPKVCQDGSGDLTLVILVNVARNRFQQRDSIRKTWGSYGKTVNISTGLVFSLGEPKGQENPDIREKIVQESKQHGDILLSNFVDEYHNVTLKVLSSLRWFSTFCKHADYVIKTDDDVYVNVPMMVSVLRNHTKTFRNKSFSMGWLHRGIGPIRHKPSKWYAPPEEFPGQTYPNYHGGFSYAMTSSAAVSIDLVAPSERFFWLEDIFVSGVCAGKANVTKIDDRRMTWKRPNPANGTYFLKQMVAPSLNIQEIHLIHEQFVNLTHSKPHYW